MRGKGKGIIPIVKRIRNGTGEGKTLLQSFSLTGDSWHKGQIKSSPLLFVGMGLMDEEIVASLTEGPRRVIAFYPLRPSGKSCLPLPTFLTRGTCLPGG